MTTKRLLLLQILLLAGLSAVFLLPKTPREQPLGIDPALPEIIGQWAGQEVAITEHEHEVLGVETEFSRKTYNNGRGDQLFVTVVLAGRDMNTSIHRPERCLPAQGWTIADSRSVSVPLTSPPNAVLRASRLHSMRSARTTDGRNVQVYSLNYYWFVGYTDLTESHAARNLIDIKDRLVKGYNQRWAYVTISGTITEGLEKFGRSEKEVDEIIQSFIRELVPRIHMASLNYD